MNCIKTAACTVGRWLNNSWSDRAIGSVLFGRCGTKLLRKSMWIDSVLTSQIVICRIQLLTGRKTIAQTARYTITVQPTCNDVMVAISVRRLGRSSVRTSTGVGTLEGRSSLIWQELDYQANTEVCALNRLL